MKSVVWFFLSCATSTFTYSQYYLQGEIKNDRGRLLEAVKIKLQSKGAFPFFSGNTGTFGISMSQKTDTITLSLDGYETIRKEIDTRKFQNFLLKMLPSTAHLYNRKLASVTTNLNAGSVNYFTMMGESYSSLTENVSVNTDKYPETGFALNVDKASYSNIRRFLNNEMFVPIDAIRIEEMLNYFNFSKLSDSCPNTKFNFQSKITTCPWNKETRLLFLHIAAPKMNLDNIPPSNLVFLIDVSGSMDKPNRLPLLQNAFKLLVANLREKDTITLVTYGGGVSIALAPTSGKCKKKINDTIDSLVAGGDTPGETAIRIAYEQAKKTFINKGNNRVILATDGDFNIGQTTERELEEMIIDYKQTGIYLTCLGVGMGNYKDSKLEALTRKGNGNFAYLDNLEEAQKVLVKEFTQTLFSVADNAYLKIHFLPNTSKEYRLIGFDNKKNDTENSTDELEGGEVGSGHTLMAIIEIIPIKNDSVTFQQDLANITIQYKLPGFDSSILQQYTVLNELTKLENADSAFRFTAAVAAFGMALKQSKYINHYQLEEIQELAKTAANPQEVNQKEFLTLIEKAINIYQPLKKKKKK